MITNIRVDGYRSLTDFSMKVIQGPNILIGPNGSGKSNIIGFFQFLSRLMSSSLSDAVSLSGGAGAFFTKQGEQEFKRSVKATVAGFTFVDDRSYGTRQGTYSYEYDFSIQASEKFDRIYFTKQTLKVARETTDHKPVNVIPGQEKKWDAIIDYSDQNIARLRLVHFNPSAFGPKNVKGQITDPKRIVDDETVSRNMAENGSLFRFIHSIHEVAYIASDITGGQTINVNPAEIKKPEDSARSPGIQSDGSGLAATLWHLQQEDNTPSLPYYYYMFRSGFGPFLPPDGGWKNTHSQIQQLIRRVNPQIESMFADNDPFDNQLKIRVKMAPLEKGVELPLSAMSDGSIKWAALITAILTHRAIFAIEEPENFLHPYMQAEIIKIMRETSLKKFSSVIMTTHSETLLNAADPEDIIVISMKDGVTYARRIEDTKQLHQEITETGFGLGNYYLAGDLTDA